MVIDWPVRSALRATPLSTFHPCPFFLPTIPLQGMKIELPPIEASVHDYIVETVGANLHDAQALWKSLATELRQRHDQDAIAIDAMVLASLPDAFRAGAEGLRISIRAREAISIRQADRTPYGLAIDLGTTTIAGYLVDLENGTAPVCPCDHESPACLRRGCHEPHRLRS